jgi:anti-sigma-K factor RskA
MTAEIDLKAAEYVLGTLAADERAAFERLLARDDEAQRAVVEWQNRLAPLSTIAGEVTPPPALWDKIEQAVHGVSRAYSDAPPANVIDLTLEARRLQRARNRWRNTAWLTGALAAGLAVFILTHDVLRRTEPNASYVAVVNRGGTLPALIVRVDLASQSIFVRPVATEVPPGRSLELWYIDQGKAPRSMGLVDKSPKEVALPRGAAIDKANFAVTVEPEGGSPTGGPTGEIVYSGQLIKE